LIHPPKEENPLQFATKVQSIIQIAVKHSTDCRPSVVTAGPRYRGWKCNVWEMCGVVERALCGGCNGGLSCLCKAIEMEWLNIKLGIDNLMTCKENEMNVDCLMFCCLSAIW